ncbi:hypothetical protein ColLi_03150 [Colletotrichum liriopes]|uniref:Integral membrane protein n=1 Tax=Colletotrichum liriopes TaxID=708192 RepID=A0AA37GGY8_9PEZI|nr:hypothetical protein ColLi_03150 [Colletotrichum liriopes]
MAPTETYGPLIGGVTWFLCFFCGAFLALRVYAKLSRGQKLWWDDYIMIFSWVGLGQFKSKNTIEDFEN